MIDAEEVLANNIHEEATHPVEIAVPEAAISDVDVTEEIPGDDFSVITSDDDMGDTVLVAADDAMVIDENDNEGEEA